MDKLTFESEISGFEYDSSNEFDAAKLSLLSDINSQMREHTISIQLANSENIFTGGKNLFTAIGSLFGFVGSDPGYQVGYFCIPNSCHSLGTYYEK